MADVLLIVGSPNFQPYPRCTKHAIIYVAQEEIEEAPLKGECFIAVERFPLLPPVCEQPFFLRCYPFESFDRSTRMQSMIRPVRTNQRRRFDVFDDRPFRRPIGVVQRMALSFYQKILCERKSAISPPFDSHLEPGRNELGLGNSAMKCQFPVKVGDSLPRNDRAQVRRLQGCDMPLRHG